MHTLTRNTFFTTSDSKRFSYHKKYPELLKFRVLKRATIYYGIHVLLTSRLYCRYRNFTDSTICMGRGLSPPVGNCTLPRRILIYFLLHYITVFCIIQVFFYKIIPPSSSIEFVSFSRPHSSPSHLRHLQHLQLPVGV